MNEGSVRNRRWWANLARGGLTIVVSSVAALLLVEVLLRGAGIGSDQFLRPDPVLGVRFIPSKAGLSQDRCYRARVSTNAHGWRGNEISLAKPEGVYRVLVLGDSFMAGLQVQDDETFSRVLEYRLNRGTAPRRVEVVNFGVPSWGTDQQYLALREYGLSFKPDLILLALYAQNDISDNYSVLQSKASTYPKPFFDIKDGELVERPFSDPTPALIAVSRWLVAPFRVYPLVRDSLLQVPLAHRLLYRLGIVGVVPREPQEAGGRTASRWRWPGRWRHQLGVYSRQYSKEWMVAWAITEALLTRARDEAERAGAEFLLVQIPDPVVVMPRSLWGDLAGNSGVAMLDVDKPTQLLEQLAHKDDVGFISLVSGFRDRIGESESEFEKYYLNCDGHWTPAGHRLAADLVVPHVAARIARAGR